ncbi:MAG: hypothetical protein ACE5KT_09675 [Methanosarcinales archaeon]
MSEEDTEPKLTKKLVELSAQQLIEQAKVPVMLESMNGSLKSMDHDLKDLHKDLSLIDKNLSDKLADIKYTIKESNNELKSVIQEGNKDLMRAIDLTNQKIDQTNQEIAITNQEMKRIADGFDDVVEKYSEFRDMMKQTQTLLKILIAAVLGVIGSIIASIIINYFLRF